MVTSLADRVEAYIREQLAKVAPERAKEERPFRLAIIQLGTYDGTIYNARQVVDRIGHLCDYILFDSAWVGYEQFIPMMRDCSPMLLELNENDPGIFVTQSVHKQLAGFSQASQIHKKDSHIKGQKRYCSHKRFNNAFMIHASTSPFYPMFASLDVNARVLDGEVGRNLWRDCVTVGIEARKMLRASCKLIKPFIPETIDGKPWESYPTEKIANDLRFFEFGNVYQYTKEKWENDHPDKAYSQDLHLSLWLTGKQVEGSWLQANADSNVFELKAYLHNIFVRVGVPVEKLSVAASENNIFSAGLTYSTRNGKVLAEIGVLSSVVCKEFSIGQAVYYADVDWEALMREVRKQKVEYQEISKYPAVSRDLALLLDKNVSFAQIVQIAKQTEKKLLQRVELFDVYEGKNLPEGKKSYAVNFILQDTEKTLNDKAIDAIMQKLIKQLTTQLGAELR